VVIHRSGLEHVIDRGEDGCSDGHDGLFSSASCPDAVELGTQITVLLAHRRPGTLDQCGFKPGCALAQAIGPAFARTFVVARADTGPRDEMAVGGEAAHVDADLGEDALRTEDLYAGD